MKGFLRDYVHGSSSALRPIKYEDSDVSNIRCCFFVLAIVLFLGAVCGIGLYYYFNRTTKYITKYNPTFDEGLDIIATRNGAVCPCQSHAKVFTWFDFTYTNSSYHMYDTKKDSFEAFCPTVIWLYVPGTTAIARNIICNLVAEHGNLEFYLTTIPDNLLTRSQYESLMNNDWYLAYLYASTYMVEMTVNIEIHAILLKQNVSALQQLLDVEATFANGVLDHLRSLIDDWDETDMQISWETYLNKCAPDFCTYFEEQSLVDLCLATIAIAGSLFGPIILVVGVIYKALCPVPTDEERRGREDEQEMND